jgi:hypothetical protein
MKPNRTMLPPDEGYLQAALVRLKQQLVDFAKFVAQVSAKV